MFPARAGMSRFRAGEAVERINVPRASGDEPAPAWTQALGPVCSPRERG